MVNVDRRGPALCWALLHGFLLLWFFHGPLSRSLAGLPLPMRVPLWLGFCVEALGVATVAWMFTLLFTWSRRGYGTIAPLVVAIAFALFYLDSILFASLGFHVNGLVLQVALQPGALEQTGLSTAEVAGLLTTLVIAVVADTLLGVLVLRRLAKQGGRGWTWALVVLALWGAERVAMGAMAYFGGDAVRVAGTTLPLQPKVWGPTFLGKFLGTPSMIGTFPVDLMPFAGEPAGHLDPADVQVDRTPDILFVLMESTRADFFRPEVMPNLSRRSTEGRVFLRHYSGAPATHYSLFNIFFGLDAQRRDAVLGAGQTPLLFRVLEVNGYSMSLIASSSVDWMDLTDTVFRDVKDDLVTNLPGETFAERDARMLERARSVVASAPKERPLFLFLFFGGSHYNYSYPERSAVFEPAWDGEGSLTAATVDAELLRNRAKNAVHEIDARLEEFLRYFADQRAGQPMLIATSDHGEEFREYGRVGHGTDLNREQLHVPLVILDERMPKGTHQGATGHVDLVPTILGLLGDKHDTGLYSDGSEVVHASAGRTALATMGWAPRFAIVGEDFKVRFSTLEAGLGSLQMTDPDDRTLPNAQEVFAKEAPRILERLRGGLKASSPPMADVE